MTKLFRLKLVGSTFDTFDWRPATLWRGAKSAVPDPQRRPQNAATTERWSEAGCSAGCEDSESTPRPGPARRVRKRNAGRRKGSPRPNRQKQNDGTYRQGSQ